MRFERIVKRLAAVIVTLSAAVLGHAVEESTGTKAVEYTSIYDIPVEPMKAGAGGTNATSLAAYKGKVLLIVNVASKCGFTSQYTGLEALYRKYKDQGLVIVGFPSNDFKGQEPGSEEEIVTFCKTKYDVSFPLFAKVTVKGADKAPLYHYLTEGNHAGKSEVGWNFNKYLVGRDGKVIAHYDSKVKPDDATLTAAIEAELGKK